MIGLKEFKIRKNKQRPNFCYSYELKRNGAKFTIFTMDGGNNFLASLEKLNLNNNQYLPEYKSTFSTVQECINFFNSKQK